MTARETLPGSSKIDVLRQSVIFANLNDEELAELAGLATERALRAGEFAFWEGDPPDRFYLVARGRVKVLKHSSLGKEFIIAFFGPGEMFGEVAVFQNRPYPASAQATTGTRALGIKRQDMLLFLGRRPEVAVRIIGVLGQRLREAQSRLRDIAGERVEQRIAGTLLMLSSKLGTSLPFTRQEIADMTGTTTETAIRVMSRLRKKGVIRSTRGQTSVVDQAALRLLAEGSLQEQPSDAAET